MEQTQQEFDRLKRAEVVFKKFSSLVEQSAQEQDAAKDKLFAALDLLDKPAVKSCQKPPAAMKIPVKQAAPIHCATT